MRFPHATSVIPVVLLAALLFAPAFAGTTAALDSKQIASASGVEAKATPDGAVKISWARTDVPLQVDRTSLSPAAGVTSWAAFAGTDQRAAMMGDTVVFEDEVDAAMDAAFAHSLSVTGLHNHFAYDQPKVYFMHIGGMGQPRELAAGVKRCGMRSSRCGGRIRILPPALVA